jgi:hypothetical protein
VRKCINREPVTKAEDLYQEIMLLGEMFSEMTLQGSEPSNEIKINTLQCFKLCLS